MGIPYSRIRTITIIKIFIPHKNCKERQRRALLIIKRKIQQEDITIVNIYAPTWVHPDI